MIAKTNLRTCTYYDETLHCNITYRSYIITNNEARVGGGGGGGGGLGGLAP